MIKRKSLEEALMRATLVKSRPYTSSDRVAARFLTSYSHHQWRRDQPHARMALPERLIAVAATADGAYIAGGAESGRIYFWEACSGMCGI